MINKVRPNFEVIKSLEGGDFDRKVIKVGILPFIKDNSSEDSDNLRMLFMKPLAENEILGSPDFQIAKGTRRINISGDWCDMREDDLIFADESFHETLIETALREGNEEIGLKADNILRLFDFGVFSFISASKGMRKPLHIFAAEMIDSNNFASFEATTSETGWFSAAAFEHKGRKDHVVIVKEVVSRLRHHI